MDSSGPDVPTRSVLHLGDCLDVLPTLESDSVDAIVCDPPYGLAFMGRAWDHGVPGEAYWREAMRVAKPGAHLLAFGGTRTHHRLMVAIEDAGWEIRDVVMWVYGSGFPKSLDVSKAIDKSAGAEREVVGIKPGHENFVGRADHPLNGGWDRPWASDPDAVAKYHAQTAPATAAAAQWQGWGTALKPAWEPVIVARKPLVGTVADNVLAHGTGALNIDACRVPADDNVRFERAPGEVSRENYRKGTCVGPAIPTDAGRWPANLIHDGSAEVVGLFSDTQPSKGNYVRKTGNTQFLGAMGDGKTNGQDGLCDSGSAARFFKAFPEDAAARLMYCPKASKADRDEGCEGMEKRQASQIASKDGGGGGWAKDSDKNPNLPRANVHPTVKPTALMRYLVRLVTPPGGVVLDPFMGSGSTGKAAMLEGFRFIGIDRDPEYFAIAQRRISHAQTVADQATAVSQPDLFTQDPDHG